MALVQAASRLSPPSRTYVTSAASARPISSLSIGCAEDGGAPGVGADPGVVEEARGLVGGVDRGGTDEPAEGEEDRERLEDPGQRVVDDVHRPALDLAGVVVPAVHHGQRTLEELGVHPDEGGDPHPEHGPGPALADGDGNPADVAQPDGGGQRVAQGLEVADLPGVVGVAGVVVPARGQAQRVDEAGERQQAREDHQHQPPADQQHDQRHAPGQVVDQRVELGELLSQTGQQLGVIDTYSLR